MRARARRPGYGRGKSVSELISRRVRQTGTVLLYARTPPADERVGGGQGEERAWSVAKSGGLARPIKENRGGVSKLGEIGVAVCTAGRVDYGRPACGRG